MPGSSWVHRQPTLLPGRPVRPERLYRARAVAHGFVMWMAFALYALYVVRDAGLTPLQMIIVGMVLELSVVAFEIPTGLLADAISRRLSVIVGTVISGAGWAVMGLFPSFEGILAGQFLWGFGFTFMSGAIEAWLSDEIGEEHAARIYPQAAQWAQGARVAGVLAGAALGLIDTRLPFIAGGLGQIALAACLLFTMTEAGWRAAALDGGSRLASMRGIAAGVVEEARRRPMVRAALAIALLAGASSEVFDRLWGYHLLENVGAPAGVDEVILFGAIAIASQAGALALIALARRASADGSRASAARVLSALYAAAVIAPLAFALAPGAGVAIAMAAATHWALAAEPPFFIVWVNRGLDPRTRATVLSSLGMTNSFGQVAQAPLFASVVAIGSVRVALALGALVVLPAVGLARTRPLEERRADDEGEPERAAV